MIYVCKTGLMEARGEDIHKFAKAIGLKSVAEPIPRRYVNRAIKGGAKLVRQKEILKMRGNA